MATMFSRSFKSTRSTFTGTPRSIVLVNKCKPFLIVHTHPKTWAGAITAGHPVLEFDHHGCRAVVPTPTRFGGGALSLSSTISERTPELGVKERKLHIMK
jgi:hypothetical protein